MAKKPNAMGRIEADPKEPFDWTWIILSAAGLALLLIGIFATIGWNAWVAGIEGNGKYNYQQTCERVAKDNQTWLECEE